jgi:hypothetical protein
VFLLLDFTAFVNFPDVNLSKEQVPVVHIKTSEEPTKEEKNNTCLGGTKNRPITYNLQPIPSNGSAMSRNTSDNLPDLLNYAFLRKRLDSSYVATTVSITECTNISHFPT